MKYYKLWKVKNGWIAVTDEHYLPDTGGGMEQVTIHHSLRAFSDYISAEEKQTKQKEPNANIVPLHAKK